MISRPAEPIAQRKKKLRIGENRRAPQAAPSRTRARPVLRRTRPFGLGGGGMWARRDHRRLGPLGLLRERVAALGELRSLGEGAAARARRFLGRHSRSWA